MRESWSSDKKRKRKLESIVVRTKILYNKLLYKLENDVFLNYEKNWVIDKRR